MPARDASTTTFTVTDDDGVANTVRAWVPAAPRAVLHVLHGWAEHSARYDRFAREAAARGIAVYADDHRGHGQTGVDAGGLGDLGPGAMDGVLGAVWRVSEEVFGRHPDVPHFLLGHSWGSFIGQRYLRRWGGGLAGALLTGTTYRAEGAAVGGRRGGPNERFEPAATAYDWLTRDAAEVQKYVDDPWCGFERMGGSPAAAGPAGEPTRFRLEDHPDTGVPADLPILVLNGAEDPIGGAEGGTALAEHYRGEGVADVTFRAYEGGRHELLNELNRDEVTGDILDWIEKRLV